MSEPSAASGAKSLTDRMVAALPRRRKRYISADPELRGHYVRVPPQGPCVFAAVARSPYGKQVWATLGTADVLTIEPAREQAREAIKRIKAGLPAFEPPPVQPDTVADVCAGWLKRHVEAKELRTGGELTRVLEKYVLPHWRDRALHDIRRSDVAALLGRGRGQARPMGGRSGVGGAGLRVDAGSPPATTITSHPSSRACGASRRRPASAAASCPTTSWCACGKRPKQAGGLRCLRPAFAIDGAAAREARDHEVVVDLDGDVWTIPTAAAREGQPRCAQAAAAGHEGAWAAAAHGGQPVCLSRSRRRPARRLFATAMPASWRFVASAILRCTTCDAARAA